MMIEMIVAVSIFGIALAMTAVIVAGITSESSTSYRQGQSTQVSQTAINYIDQLVRNATTPANAWTSIGGNPKPYSSTNTTGVPASGTTEAPVAGGSSYLAPCWGSTYFMTPNGSSALNASAPSNFPSATSLPALQAYDGNFIFCAFRPGTSWTSTTGPHIFQIKINTSTCTGSYGYCTLALEDWGTDCDPLTGTLNGTGASCSATTFESYNDEWCDTYCQGCPTTVASSCSQLGTGLTSSTFVTASGGSTAAPWNNGGSTGTYIGSSQVNMPAYGFGCTNLLKNSFLLSGSSCSVATPSIFCYYGSTAPTSTSTCAGLNSPEIPMDLYSSAGADNLGSIQNVTINFTSLVDVNTSLNSPDGRPGTSISQNVPIVNAYG